MILYLIRHGESTSNIAGTFTGQLEADLSEQGLRQAGCIQNYFLGKHIDKIYASDLSRAYNTVLPLSKVSRVPIETDENLREIYGGKWEGERFTELCNLFPEDYACWRHDISNCRCTGGESIRELLRRVSDTVERIAVAHSNETVVVATHATPIRVLLTKWLTGDAFDMQSVSWVPNASITKVEYKDGVFTPVEIGITDHLESMITNLPNQI